LVGINCPVSAQLKPVDALQKLYDKYPQEKIYLWYNKAGYVAGETLWFKAYVFSGYDVSLISTNLFVELYDANKKLISSKMLPLISGIADGSIDIDNKTEEGVYYIRAYTPWMLNFDPAFQYIHPITVYNSASAKKLNPNRSLWKIIAAPEGGNLVDGLETKVAVRRLATVELDKKWGGYLYEENNPAIKLKEFTSLDENVALFSFIPEAGKKYHVYAADENNRQEVVLPAVQPEGVAISVQNNTDTITYQLRFKNIPGYSLGYSLLAEVQQEMVYTAEFKKASPVLTLPIPANKLGNGIVHLTLFDPQHKPVAERLVFANQEKLNEDRTTLTTPLFSAKQRAKNEWQLTVDSLNWISYGISVTDADAPSSSAEENILSAVWFTSDIANPVQQPAQYFSNVGQSKKEAVDAILISEKWSRYNWPGIINNNYLPLNFLYSPYLSFAGKVTRAKKIISNGEVDLFLRYPDSTLQFMLTKTDSSGNIILNNLAFPGDMTIYYQLNNSKSSAKSININFERISQFVPYSLPLPVSSYILTIPSSIEKKPDWITRADIAIRMETEIKNKYKVLQEVIVKSKLRTATDLLNEKISSGLFSNYSDIVFDFINEPQKGIGYTNILDWLQGRVAGLSFTYLSDGSYKPTYRGSDVPIYINEWQADATLAGSLSMSDIALVKFISNFGLYGGYSIAIYTIRGDIRPAKKDPSFPRAIIKGYDVMKKVFTPDYGDDSKPKPENDTRDQLLWQPVLPPSVAKDRSKVIFYNNDNTRRFRITVQGFTANGIPVYFEKIITPPSIN
jgi:hypothetical protein